MNRLRVLLTAMAFLAVAPSYSQDSGSEIAAFAHEAYRTRVATEPGCASRVYEAPASAFAFATPSPVPYPTPAGGSARPKEKDLPVFPDAELLDAFVLEAGPDAIDGRDRTVQLYRTAAPIQEVLAYFDATLVAGNWALQTIGVGPDGVECGWVPWAERQDSFLELLSSYIKVTTAYVGHEVRGAATPSPGFQGKGVPFVQPEPGFSWFWVITPR